MSLGRAPRGPLCLCLCLWLLLFLTREGLVSLASLLLLSEEPIRLRACFLINLSHATVIVRVTVIPWDETRGLFLPINPGLGFGLGLPGRPPQYDTVLFRNCVVGFGGFDVSCAFLSYQPFRTRGQEQGDSSPSGVRMRKLPRPCEGHVWALH